jgi:Ion channel
VSAGTNAGIAIALPLVIGTSATFLTVVVHALALATIVRVVRHELLVGYAGARFWKDAVLVTSVTLFALAAHLIEIGVWAEVLRLCGEFAQFSSAFYHSAVNYTSLGYGDVIMSPSWRLLGPLEAGDGMLMFGVSTGMIFGVIQRLIETRYGDERRRIGSNRKEGREPGTAAKMGG